MLDIALTAWYGLQPQGEIVKDDFQVTIDSLGNTALSWVPGVQEVRIWPNAATGSALMEVCLLEDSWPAREAAIEKLVELRGLFLDDLSLDYRFAEGRCAEPTVADDVRQFVPA